jgi:hypothetical protein
MNLRSYLLIATAIMAVSPVAHAAKWYEEMKIGPAWSNTFNDTYQGQPRVAALKGILIALGDGKSNALFDTETLRQVSAYSGFVNWGGTPWTGQHGVLISLQDDSAIVKTASGPGWADGTGSFEDKRAIPGFGNLKDATYQGFFRAGNVVVLDYKVLGSRVLETSSMTGETLTRSLRIDARSNDLLALLADEVQPFILAADHLSALSADGLKVAIKGTAKLTLDSNHSQRLLLAIDKGGDATTVQVAFSRTATPIPAAEPDFATLIKGEARIWAGEIVTEGKVSAEKNASYAVDLVTLPEDNPWKSSLRFGGFDFIDEDRAALSTWNGDVWVVKGLKGDWKQLTWQRVAAGLFETLGLKVVEGRIYVNGRDQITELIDLNGDGEIDQFKVFNRDVIISSNFHEFATDLQTDKAGNFYFTKASPVVSGGRGFDLILPHHGVVAKISSDGKKFEVVATGLRAPNGIGIGPNGEISTGENEGTWTPACKINLMRPAEAPVYFGCEPSRHELKTPYVEPLCFMPMNVDNSGGAQTWVPPGAKIGLKSGEMLHLSYGQSGIYRVLPQRLGTRLQAGVTRLPINLQSSAMRARFHPDGSLYVLGFRGWQTNAATECAFQRVRYTGVPVPVPDHFEATAVGVRLHFAEALNKEIASDVTSYNAQRWNYVRSVQYGSGEFSVDHPDLESEKNALENESKGHRIRDAVTVKSAKLQADGRTVELELEGMKPSLGFKVGYDLEDDHAKVIKGEVFATIYALK